MLSQRGSTLISVAIASIILVLGVLYFQRSSNSLRKIAAQADDKLIADAYAAELLDLFRGYSTDDLLNYLKTNPTGAGTAYPLCAHVNLLDRTTGKVLNRDPIAALPPENLLEGVGPTKKANRFYQVHIVDMSTLTIKKSPFCNQNANTLGARAAHDRLMVTVGVSWVPNGAPVAAVRRVVMSTVLPL